MTINIPDESLRDTGKEVPVELLNQLRLVKITQRSDYISAPTRSVKTLELLMHADGEKHGFIVTEGRFGEKIGDLIHHTRAEFFHSLETAIVSFYDDKYISQKP